MLAGTTRIHSPTHTDARTHTIHSCDMCMLEEYSHKRWVLVLAKEITSISNWSTAAGTTGVEEICKIQLIRITITTL